MGLVVFIVVLFVFFSFKLYEYSGPCKVEIRYLQKIQFQIYDCIVKINNSGCVFDFKVLVVK